jgi:hypothetical protein
MPKEEQTLTPRTVHIDSDFLGKLTSENKKMNAMRAKMMEPKLNSSEEILQLAKEGLEARERIRNIS